MTTATAEPEVIEQEDATDEAEAQAPADEAAETPVEAGETPEVRDGDDATDWSKIDADAIAALRAAVEHHK